MMNDSDNARLTKAAMKSLRVPAPEALKAELKALARNRMPKASFWENLREISGTSAWAYGAGTVFAVAGICFFMLRAIPEQEFQTTIVQRPVRHLETLPAQTLRDLWSEDDGEDNDEI